MLHIHRAERADGLVEALGALTADPLDDPMAAEIIAVPTRGIERWLSQRLSVRLGAGPGRADGALPAEHTWQARLWRRLRKRIGTPSPAERLERGCARLAEEPALAGLPARLSLFGLTRLPPSYLQVLRALAAGRDVHLFL